MAIQGILAGAIVLLILNVWTTQDNTIYAFSVAGANMFRTKKRHAFVLGGATFALILTLSGIYEQTAELFDFSRYRYSSSRGHYYGGFLVPPSGTISQAWILLCRRLTGRGRFPMLWLARSHTSLANANLGIGPVNGIISAVVLYAVLTKVIPQTLRPAVVQSE